MCEFCVRHGDGRKWYLQAKNYAADLASDLRRQRLVSELLSDPARRGRGALAGLARRSRVPRPVRRLASALRLRQAKRDHFGQVVPIEDVERIFEMVSAVVRLPCACRQSSRGRSAGYCFGLSVDGRFAYADMLDPGHWSRPDSTALERPPNTEALALMRGFEAEGLLHSVWTFGTPFIGGLCNCDGSDCLAMRSVRGGLPTMFKGEYVAEIEWERCRGCRDCMRQCQFGAISHSRLMERCQVEAGLCWGCGICRAACARAAISLRERSGLVGSARSAG